jgi:hypothetical protein
MATASKILIGIDNQVIELTGADKEAFIADQKARVQESLLLETKYKEKQEAKQNILKKLGLTQDELETLLGA